MTSTPTPAQGNAKPSLTGVRIKQRKRVQKATAKHEPNVFRDQLYRHFETVPDGDLDGIAQKLDAAGNTLDYRKYAEALFEILVLGGLLAPGGAYLDDGAPSSPFSILRASDPATRDGLKPYVEVLNKLIRRYKYLQKILEESSLPGILQYVNKWDQAQRDKVAIAVGLMMSSELVSAAVLSVLAKEHLVKDGAAISFVTNVFRTYLSAGLSMDKLGNALKRGGIRDLTVYLPATKRSEDEVVKHFRAEGLPQIAEYQSKRASAGHKEETAARLAEMAAEEEPADAVIAYLNAQQAAHPLPAEELPALIWNSLMTTVDFGARPDQIEALTVREAAKHTPVFEAFAQGPRAEVALINAAQVWFYDNTKAMKAFPQIVKLFYNKDCVSDAAIIYWFQKGSKPQGRQHFLKATEALVKFLQEQSDSEEEDEE